MSMKFRKKPNAQDKARILYFALVDPAEVFSYCAQLEHLLEVISSQLDEIRGGNEFQQALIKFRNHI